MVVWTVHFEWDGKRLRGTSGPQGEALSRLGGSRVVRTRDSRYVGALDDHFAREVGAMLSLFTADAYFLADRWQTRNEPLPTFKFTPTDGSVYLPDGGYTPSLFG